MKKSAEIKFLIQDHIDLLQPKAKKIRYFWCDSASMLSFLNTSAKAVELREGAELSIFFLEISFDNICMEGNFLLFTTLWKTTFGKDSLKIGRGSFHKKIACQM